MEAESIVNALVKMFKVTVCARFNPQVSKLLDFCAMLHLPPEFTGFYSQVFKSHSVRMLFFKFYSPTVVYLDLSADNFR